LDIVREAIMGFPLSRGKYCGACSSVRATVAQAVEASIYALTMDCSLQVSSKKGIKLIKVRPRDSGS
jgi:hypothetical protein